jgi:hypothetical protein
VLSVCFSVACLISSKFNNESGIAPGPLSLVRGDRRRALPKW